MPTFGSNIHLLSHEGAYLRHVHFRPEADTYSWGKGLRQHENFPLLGLCLDKKAYEYFADSIPAPLYNFLVERNSVVETRFSAYQRSSLDIISVETAEYLRVALDSLIPPSTEGHAIFDLAGMPMVGGLLGKFSYRDPVSLCKSFSHSMIYVAECDEDIVSWKTVENLKVRNGNTSHEETKFYIPLN